jgi:alkylation response protein AidB-like acyl-CoA dehydrogenase
MQFDLQPITDPGRPYVALAEAHVEELANRAAAHDREGSFPTDNIAALRASGLLAACAPREFGGLGVASIHDQMVALSRLGRGDGSTAIATNMHTTFVLLVARDWASCLTAGNTERADRLASVLAAVSRGEAVLSAIITEPGTEFLRPRSAVTRTDGGWLLNGRKSFATMSGVATLGGVTFRVTDAEGDARIGVALLPTDRDGLAVQYDWDALGMRASGSHDVVFANYFIPEAEVDLVGPWGEHSEWTLTISVLGNFGLLGCFLGIAEAARDLAVGLVTSRRSSRGRLLAETYAAQHTVAEMEIDLAACRAMLARTAVATDDFFAAHASGAVELNELHDLHKDFQCTKWVVNRKAIEIVDRALQLSGGSGYLSRSPLAQLYRDVRAGPFMQPYSPNEAFQYIGKVALGLDPRID